MTGNSGSRIVIVGAGPGGLMAARVLQRGGLNVRVCDADGSAAERNPGGTLDLHADSGQIAMEDAGLTGRFTALARPEGQGKRLLDPVTGELLKEFAPGPGDFAAPEIDRGHLRALLADSVTGDAIRWGRKLTGIRREGDEWLLAFADGPSETADIVIGADGAWSRVRPAVTDARPDYTGVSFVELLFTDVDARHPEIAALVGDGHMWANGDGRNIILQRSSGGVVRGYLGMRAELGWLAAAGLGAHDGRGGIVLDSSGVQAAATEKARGLLLERFADFAPGLRRLIAASEGGLANRPIFALPAPLTWAHVPGVTLLGDAAHVMSPFGGNGVNFALLDAAELARGLVRATAGHTDADEAIRQYENAMFQRTGPAAVAANEAIADHYRAGGASADDVPDFAEETRRWQENAAAYREARGA